MAQSYGTLLKGKDPTKTPQTKPLKGRKKDMRKNAAGGWGFKIDPFNQVKRFLLIGSAAGTYYIRPDLLTDMNKKVINQCLDTEYERTVDLIVDTSLGGKAAKNDPALAALAIAASHKNVECRSYALRKLNAVARTATHLFTFHNYVEAMRGHGQALNKALKRWYQNKAPDKLAYQVTKYRAREGWTHRDVLRLCKPKPRDQSHDDIYAYAVGKLWWDEEQNTLYIKRKYDPRPRKMQTHDALKLFEGFEKAKNEKRPRIAIQLIQEYGLTHEMISNEVKDNPAVWEALLQNMPLTATMRNLGKLTSIGLLKPMSAATKLVRARFGDKEILKRARMHPLNALVAHKTYDQGHGMKGSLSWTVVPQLVDALEDMFYDSFEYVEPANKRTFIGLDVSGSMGWVNVSGIEVLNCAELTAAMSMVTARTEPDYHIMGFAHVFKDLNITARDNLTVALRKVRENNFGGTDVSLPFKWALQNRVEVDTFAVYTDNETWSGGIHPVQALNKYREKMGINARSVVVAAAANKVSCADPDDGGMLDVAGFSTDTPSVIAAFSRGEF